MIKLYQDQNVLDQAQSDQYDVDGPRYSMNPTGGRQQTLEDFGRLLGLLMVLCLL